MPKNLLKELQAVNKDLKVLSKKVDKMIVAVGELEKPKVVKKAKAVKAKPIKKVAAKKPVAKKVTKVTAADTVLRLINRYKKGVGTATLMKKTGYNQKKIANIVFKLKKQGKITSVGMGVYIKA
jgi:hypothetical protein